MTLEGCVSTAYACHAALDPDGTAVRIAAPAGAFSAPGDPWMQNASYVHLVSTVRAFLPTMPVHMDVQMPPDATPPFGV